MQTLYRAATSARNCGSLTWWADERDVAEAYRDNQGYGGPAIYALETASDAILDLTAGQPHYSRDDVEMIAMLADVLGDEDLPDNRRGDYIHDVLEDAAITDALRARYDWVVIYDSYPEGARTWLRLRATAGERARKAR